MKALLIEDDTKLAQHLEESLKEIGFFVTMAASKEDVEAALGSPLRVDLVLMDRLLGNFDSKQFIGAIKNKWPEAPAIVLSAVSTPNERTDALNSGADDYLGKPFSSQELIARIRAQLRKSKSPPGNFLKVGDLVIDSIQRVITCGEKTATLPAREFALLRSLAQDPSRIWPKEELLDYVWGQASEVETNVVEVTITNVRRKLKDLGSTIEIKNLRNSGYWIAK